MNTWRVQPSRAQWWFVRVYFWFTTAGFALTLIWVWTAPRSMSVVSAGFGLQMISALCFSRSMKQWTTASERGVESHNGFRTRRWRWSEIRGLHEFGRYENEFKLDLRNGKTVAIPGVDHDAVPVLSDLIDRYAGTAGAPGR